MAFLFSAAHNPCATVVLAHLTAQATRNDPTGRAAAKLALTRRLYRLGYTRDEIVRLYRFIDWLLRLPEALERETWAAIKAFEKEQQMTYVTYGERIGRQEGRQEGLQVAIALGLELKFGEPETRLLSEIQQIDEMSVLQAIIARIKTATTPDEVRAVYAPSL